MSSYKAGNKINKAKTVQGGNVATAFKEFELFRRDFIKKWCKGAAWSEERKSESSNVRPVVIIRTQKRLNELNADIENDQRLLAILATEPERFNPNATKFKPIAEPFRNVTRVALSQPAAKTVRKKTKEEVLRALGRLVDRLEHMWLARGTDDSKSTFDTARNEFKAIQSDEEEIYQIRTYGYTDTCVYLTQNGVRQDRKRVPFTGMFISDLNGLCHVEIVPKEDPALAIKNYQVSPISCSTILRGLLYRDSDVQKYKAKLSPIKR